MIRQALDRHARASVRDWGEERVQTVGASEIGQCARRVWFTKNEDDGALGAARDADHEDGWGGRIRGSVYEAAWWEPALRAQFGDALLYAGPQQRTFSDGFLSATPDGVIVGLERDALSHLGVPDLGSDAIVTDCKTIDPRSRLDEAKPEHVYQVQVQLGLVRLRTNHRPNYGLLSYTNASIWSEVAEFPVAFDADVFAAAQSRATDIMTARASSDLAPEGYVAGGRECDLCPFTRPCGQARAARVPDRADPIEDEARDGIAALARRAKVLRIDADETGREARRIEEQVREALSSAGTRKIATPDLTVSWSPVKGRTSWDIDGLRAAAEAAGVDVSPFRTDGPPSDRLAITLKGEKQKD